MTGEQRPRTDLSVHPVTVLVETTLKLRTAIMTGEFLPGEKLVESDLCRRMGISRPSLREALRRLEAESLVELIPNRGPYVAKMGPPEVEQTHDVWAMLTSEAVYRFAKRAQPSDITALEGHFHEIVTATDAGNAMGHLTATNAFFRVVLEGCGNKILAQIIRNLVSRINFLRARSMAQERRQRVCIAQLGELIAALRQGDAEAARLATRRHIDAACEGAKELPGQQAVA